MSEKFDPKTPSTVFEQGETVRTEYGLGVIEKQDSSFEGWPKKQTVWLDRWGVRYEKLPEGKPQTMFPDNVLYHPTSEIQKLS